MKVTDVAEGLATLCEFRTNVLMKVGNAESEDSLVAPLYTIVMAEARSDPDKTEICLPRRSVELVPNRTSYEATPPIV